MSRHDPILFERLTAGTHWLKQAALVALWVIACGCSAGTGDPSDDPVVGGESHFLTACSDDSACGAGLSCVCGVCTQTCASDAACRLGAVTGTCAQTTQLPGACSGAASPPASVCTLSCAAEADCDAIDASLTCTPEGVCDLEATSMPPGKTPMMCPPDRPDTCGGSCVDTQTDTAHCGACGTVCSGDPNGAATCQAGQCGLDCDTGFQACAQGCCPAPVNLPAAESWAPDTEPFHHSAPTVRVDAQGYPHVVFTRHIYEVRFFEMPVYDIVYAHWDGNQWRQEEVAADIPGDAEYVYEHPLEFVLDDQGTPHIFYKSADGFTYTTRDGAAWNAVTVRSVSPMETVPLNLSVHTGGYFDVALDEAGQPHFAYFICETATDACTLFYASADTGQPSVSESAVPVTGVTRDTMGPGLGLSVEQNGVVHIVGLFGAAAPGGALQYVRRDTGGSWTPVSVLRPEDRVSDDSDSSVSQFYEARIDFDGQHTPQITLVERAFRNTGVDDVIDGNRLIQGSWQGTAWDFTVVDAQWGDPQDQRGIYIVNATTGYDRSGQLYAIYFMHEEDVPHYAYPDGASMWRLSSGAFDGNMRDEHSTSIAVDAQGHVHTMYEVSGRVRYNRWDGTDWLDVVP